MCNTDERSKKYVTGIPRKKRSLEILQQGKYLKTACLRNKMLGGTGLI
jgi:hypothetical protein